VLTQVREVSHQQRVAL